MINVDTGEVKIRNDFCLSSKYSFEQFIKSDFYKNQSESRLIQLGSIQNDEGLSIYVSLFFSDSLLKKIMLMIADSSVQNFDEEPQRKVIHDKYLESIGLEVENEFFWGRVISDYDSRSNTSHIIITYN